MNLMDNVLVYCYSSLHTHTHHHSILLSCSPSILPLYPIFFLDTSHFQNSISSTSSDYRSCSCQLNQLIE